MKLSLLWTKSSASIKLIRDYSQKTTRETAVILKMVAGGGGRAGGGTGGDGLGFRFASGLGNSGAAAEEDEAVADGGASSLSFFNLEYSASHINLS